VTFKVPRCAHVPPASGRGFDGVSGGGLDGVSGSGASMGRIVGSPLEQASTAEPNEQMSEQNPRRDARNDNLLAYRPLTGRFDP